MKNINKLVKDKVRSLSSMDTFEQYKNMLGREQRHALEEAERLADLYKEIKPEKITLSGKHLFALPD